MTVQYSPSANVSLDFALALVESSSAPLLLLDGDCKVIAASTSFSRAFHVARADVLGRLLFTIGAGEWNVPQLRSLLTATAVGLADIEAYEMDLRLEGRAARCLVINAKRLFYSSGEDIRLVVTVTDVTDVRLADRARQSLVGEMADIKREKAILLQELQHRVANSLQIIASVLMQTARRVQSDETRSHLHDAHHRLMSVATLQKQLAISTMDDVQLHSYFADLCQSIGASMIRDHNEISVVTEVDDSVIAADASVILGLVVTELVINALKHAFPNNRRGKITVSYRSEGSGWTLMVGDDGVGMPVNPESANRGVGTSIVGALARQLNAGVTVTGARPGTRVSLVHAAFAKAFG